MLNIFLFILCNAIAQQKVIDSLEQQLLNPTNGNSKLDNLIELGHFYSMVDPEKGLTTIDKAIKIAITRKDSFKLGTAYGNKGKNYITLGNDSLAFAFYDKAEDIFKTIDSTKALSKLMFNKGLLYSERSNYQKAAYNVKNALEIFTTQKDTLLMGYSLGTLAYYRIYLGDYVSSMNDFLNGMLLLEKINQEESLLYASVQANKGILHQRLGEYDTALTLHQKSLEVFKKHGNLYLTASQYSEIGNIFSLKKNFNKALTNYKAAYDIDKKINNVGRMAASLSNIGLTYSHLKLYDKSIKYIDTAISINKNVKDYGKLSINYHNKGETLHKKNNIIKARDNFSTSLFYAKKLGDKRMIYEAKLGISKMASIGKDFKTAFNVLDEALAIRDTLFSDDKNEELAVLKTKYEYEKEKAILEADFQKNKAIDKAKIKQQTLIKNMSIGGGLVGISILAIVLTLLRRKKEAELNGKLATSELRKLRAQLNPHFIFNSLNSINDFVQKNEKEKATDYIGQFSIMMRKILDNSQEEEIPLEKEIEFLEGYIKLEQQRLKNGFTYKIVVDNDIDKENTLVPPALFQPFIENSIIYGLLEKKKEGTLLITFSKAQNTLICTIDDNGIGMKHIQDKKKKSFGISGSQNRVDLLKQLKNSEAQIEIIEKEEGVRVTLQIPLSLEF